MTWTASFSAAAGIAIIAYLVFQPRRHWPCLKKLEPVGIGIGLCFLFCALHGSVTAHGGGSDRAAPHHILQENHFTKFCETQLKGEGSFSGIMAYCTGNNTLLDSRQLY